MVMQPQLTHLDMVNMEMLIPNMDNINEREIPFIDVLNITKIKIGSINLMI